jgi:hypothetical protein
MDGYAADIVSDFLAFAGMEPRANFDPERSDFVCDRTGAPDRPRRAVERDQKSIAKSFDLTSSKPQNIPPDGGVMSLKDVAPAAIAKRGRFLRRTRNVSKKYSGEHPVCNDLRFSAMSRFATFAGKLPKRNSALLTTGVDVKPPSRIATMNGASGQVSGRCLYARSPPIPAVRLAANLRQRPKAVFQNAFGIWPPHIVLLCSLPRLGFRVTSPVCFAVFDQLRGDAAFGRGLHKGCVI